MGRYTGWIALEAGIAGGADAILIPEFPFDIEDVYESISRRQAGKNFSLIVVAEGAIPKGGGETLYNSKVDEFGHERLGGIGYHLVKEIKKKFPKTDARVVILGLYLQRGGSPVAFDRVLATRYGIAAIDLVHKRKFGFMVALQGSKIGSVALKEIAGKRKRVSPELYEMALTFSR